MDEDALVYKGLAAALTIITLTKLKEYVNEPLTRIQIPQTQQWKKAAINTNAQYVTII